MRVAVGVALLMVLVATSRTSAAESIGWSRLIWILQQIEAEYPEAQESGAPTAVLRPLAWADEGRRLAAALGSSEIAAGLDWMHGRIATAEEFDCIQSALRT
jgi:hypothetical protein